MRELKKELVDLQVFAATCMERRDEPEFTMFSEIVGRLSTVFRLVEDVEKRRSKCTCGKCDPLSPDKEYKDKPDKEIDL